MLEFEQVGPVAAEWSEPEASATERPPGAARGGGRRIPSWSRLPAAAAVLG